MGWLAASINFKFIRPVYFNDTIECRIILNQDNTRVAWVNLKGDLPLDEEKAFLSQMFREWKRAPADKTGRK